MARDPSETVAVVLVHGACHGGWCWEDVTGPLSGRGWSVEAVELPLSSLVDDAEAVRVAVSTGRAAGKAVLLVGHSYGGFVISEGGHEADHLVYVAGVMPEPGKTLSDPPQALTAEAGAAFVVAEDGLHGAFDPAAAPALFYNRCDPDRVAAAVARQRPMSLLCLGQPVERPAWMQLPSSYVVCTEDHAISPAYQRERAKLTQHHLVLKTDHSPFYSATDELVGWLDTTAQRLAT